MRDLSLTLSAALVLSLSASSAFAQRGSSSPAVVDLGTYHVASETWIPNDALSIPQDSLYDNTCIPDTGLIAVEFTAEPEIVVDVGQIPGPDNTAIGADPGLLHEEYLVQGFRMAVCPAEPDLPTDPTPITATLFWWNCLGSCLFGGDISLLTPTATIAIDNIPAGGVGGTCFIFDVDISGTAMEFMLTGDCDGTYEGPIPGAGTDTFGYGMTVQRTDGQPLTNTVSFGLGGDPGTQTVGSGCQLSDGSPGPGGFIGESTRFLNPTRHADSSTGFGNSDDFIDAVGGAVPFCFSFGYSFGLPNTDYVGLFHEIYGVPVVNSEFPDFCNGDGGDQMGCTDCPCMNNSPQGTVGGCLNSAGTSSRLIATGDPSLSLPPGDTTDLRLQAQGMPPTAFGVLISGNAVAPGNMANPCFGMDSGVQFSQFDGLRCAVQQTQRHGGRSANGQGVVNDSAGPSRVWGGEAQPAAGIGVQGGFVAGQTRFFQINHREDAMAGCMRGLNNSQAVGVTFTP